MLPKGNKAAAVKQGAAAKLGAAPPRNAYREAFLKGTGQAESAEVLFARCAELEDALEALKVRYEQFFLGLTRHPPRREHDVVRSELLKLRGGFLRNTGVRFRASSLYNKLLSYERMWERTVREMEDGTYRRDLFKARLRRKDHEEDAEGAVAQQKLDDLSKKVAQAPSAPAAAPATRAPMPPPAAASNGGLSDQAVRAIYDAYVSAKRQCKESTQGLTPESLAATLRKQVPSLLSKHNATTVDFKVVIKGGKAVLKALPK